MTKEKARECLENYLKDTNGKIPIKDEIAYDIFNNGFSSVLTAFTFRHLLCIAYDLTPTKQQQQ